MMNYGTFFSLSQINPHFFYLQIILNLMNSLSLKNYPPQLSLNYDFIHDESFEQSDYEDEIILDIGTHTFIPSWNAVIPLHQQNINCFCPFCGNYVQISQAMACKIEGSKGICLGHKYCVHKQQKQEIKFQYEKSTYTIEKGFLQTSKSSSILGEKEYLLSTIISHPLTSYKYARLQRKMMLSGNHFVLNFEDEQESILSYDANRIIVPLAQMNIKLELRQIGKDNNIQKMNFNIDLSEIFVGIEMTEKQSSWIITTSDQNGLTAKIEVQLLFDNTTKQQQVDRMNFKYSYPLINNLPLIKINKILLKTRQSELKIMNSGIENTKTSSNNYEDLYQSQGDIILSSINLIQSMEIRVIEPVSFVKETKVQYQLLSKKVQSFSPSKIQSQGSAKKAQPQILSQPYTQDIRSLSKTQCGSKQLQKRIREMKSIQRECFIDEISRYFGQFIQNDYANYMVQTLVGCCNSKQRFKVFNLLKEQIIDLVCLKQGTFAFQQMICYMDTHEEYAFFTQLMAENFGKVVMDSNGNHFLRKLIPIIPFAYTEIILNTVYDNFLEFVNNKNSVCVLKVILHTIAKQNESEKIKEIRNKLLEKLNINREKVIRNQFGNYFIQEAFETFGETEMRTMSQFLFMKFRILAKQKFSSSVLCKCISSYWRGSHYYYKLKSKISNTEIVELFKNKQGNKVLLELMFSQIENSFKDKVSAAISHFFPSKFNSSKWNNLFGSFGSFRMTNSLPLHLSQPLEYSGEIKVSPMAKKKPYINIIQ